MGISSPKGNPIPALTSRGRATLLARVSIGGGPPDKTTEKIGRRDGDGRTVSFLARQMQYVGYGSRFGGRGNKRAFCTIGGLTLRFWALMTKIKGRAFPKSESQLLLEMRQEGANYVTHD